MRIQNFIFNLWNKFDMWYWKKYKKDSPITTYLSKLNSQQTNPQIRWYAKYAIYILIMIMILDIGLRLYGI